MQSWQLITVLFASGVVCWLLLLGLIPWLAARQIVDLPGSRTLHQGSVPRGGGLAIIVCLLAVVIYASVITAQYRLGLFSFFYVLSWALLGWIDDVKNLRVRTRFAVQLVLALALIGLIGYVDQVYFGALGTLPLGVLAIPVTLLAILWVVNLTNFMDGMDGIAGAQLVVAALTWAFLLWLAGDTFFTLFSLGLAGAAYGFLLKNWHPASVFMGDVGSIAGGACIVLLSLVGVVYQHVPVLAAVMIMGVFIADASITLVKRLVRGEAIWEAHRSHYYQRLATAGYGHAHIVLAYTALMTLCSVLAVLASKYTDGLWIALLLYLTLMFLSIISAEKLIARTANKIQKN